MNIKTSLGADKLHNILEQIDSVKSSNINTDEEVNSARVELTEGSNGDLACAEIAKQIVEQGGALYQMQREQRDLETLFRELTKGEGVAHAA